MDNDFKETIAPEESENNDGKLTPEEQKFLDMLDEGRPAPLEYEDSPAPSGSDNADIASSNDHSESKRVVVLKTLAYTVFVVAVILGVYYFFPKQHKGKRPIEHCHSIEELPTDTFADERYGALLRDALDSYFKGEFNRCIEVLHPHLNEILADRKSKAKAQEVLSLYVHTLRFANLPPNTRREAIEMLAKLSLEEQDNTAWRVALMHIIYKDILDYKRLFEQSKTKIRNWRDLLARCNAALDLANSLEMSQRQRIAAADDDLRPRLRSELVDLLS
ncbi:MAG: hypothetical protein IJS15_01790, partial [Victivallales bacterium]|nr:hypothetical protein [Victivallales bacterium]